MDGQILRAGWKLQMQVPAFLLRTETGWNSAAQDRLAPEFCAILRTLCRQKKHSEKAENTCHFRQDWL